MGNHHMKTLAILGTVALAMSGVAQGASFTTESGFGSLLSLNSCKSGANTAAFATGTVLDASNISGECVGFFGVAIDTTTQTITLTGLEFGNYESAYLKITGISEVTITSLSTISYVPLFAPNHYSEPGTYGGVPMPQLSFTGNSIDIGFTTYNEEIPQFTFDGEGGTAVFAYSAAPVPEPETYALMLMGLGLLGFIARRKTQNPT